MGKRKIIHLKESELQEYLLESVKNIIAEHWELTHPDELMEYMWIKPNVSRLNVDVFVDDSASYIRYNHQPVLYARNGYNKDVSEFIVFAINSKPIILNPEIEYGISYNDIFDIQDFICQNLEGLKKMADGGMDADDFVLYLQRPSIYALAESKELIFEMATLKTKDSGLPVDIWLDEGGLYRQHAPRIKFRASHEQRTTNEFSSMLLTNPPTIENFPKDSPIKKKDLDKIKQFVVNNLVLLKELADGKIDYRTEFLKKYIK